MTFSTHFVVDHTERMCYIGLNIGWGNIIFVLDDEKEEKRYCLTDTGLMEVFSLSSYHNGEDYLITAYPISHKVAKALYSKAGYDRVPYEYEQLIKRMKIHRMAIAQMEGKNLDDFE